MKDLFSEEKRELRSYYDFEREQDMGRIPTVVPAVNFEEEEESDHYVWI